MRRTNYSSRTLRQILPGYLLTAFLLPVLLLTVSSCAKESYSDAAAIDPHARQLTVSVRVPGGTPATKAAAGDLSSIDPESNIYNLQVWMFNHQAADATDADDEPAVSYTEIDLTGWTNSINRPSGYYDQWSSTTTYEVPLYIPGYIMDRDEADMKFDFYVLANSPSILGNLNRLSTRGQLKAASFGKNGNNDPFGPTAPKVGVDPLAAINAGSAEGPGVPISGFFNRIRKADGTVGEADGVDLSFLKSPVVTASEAQKRSPVVQMVRAVSKLRFVFAKSEGITGVQVTRIVIDGEVIPNQTYIFPREDGSETAPTAADAYTGSGAVTIAAGDASGSDEGLIVGSGDPLISNADLLAVADPEALRSDSEIISTGQTVAPVNMSAQEYDDFLTAMVGDKKSTQRYVYLRESGKPIKGTIYYKMSDSDTERSADFSMPDPVTSATNFHRNHSWTVYAYFKGGYQLRIWTEVMPWELMEETTTFSSQIQCEDVSVTGAIENTAAYIAAHGDSNHDLDNYTTGDVPSTSDLNYYSRYYQVRRLDMNGQGYFEIKFKPAAPYGGYWMLEPVFIGEGSSDKFDIEVQGVVGGESDVLMGQIMKTEVVIHIKPKNYNYATDENSYAMILKSYFSPSHNFDPAYSADSEFQDVHRDGRFSYWRFTLTHGDY